MCVAAMQTGVPRCWSSLGFADIVCCSCVGGGGPLGEPHQARGHVAVEVDVACGAVVAGAEGNRCSRSWGGLWGRGRWLREGMKET